MLSRKEMINALDLTSLIELTDKQIEILYKFHTKETDPNNKENIVLEFINTLFKINDVPKIDNLEAFEQVSRENLLFDALPKPLAEKIEKVFSISIPTDEHSCGSLYIKNMVKSLKNHEFMSLRKDITVTINNIKKKKPVMIYTIKRKN